MVLKLDNGKIFSETKRTLEQNPLCKAKRNQIINFPNFIKIEVLNELLVEGLSKLLNLHL